MLKPYGDKVLVELEGVENAYGLVIPKSYGTSYDIRRKLTTDEVLSLKAVVQGKGESVSLPISIGDTVYVRAKGGHEIRVDQKLMVLYDERGIVAKG